MKNELISEVKSTIKKGDLDEFTLVLKSELSQSEVGAVFNLFCESQKLSLDYKSGWIPYAISFANIFPSYYFQHLNRLYTCNLNDIVDLFDESLYLKFENEYSDEIIKHLKTAYFYYSFRESFLDMIEEVEFSNERILQVIDELFILRNLQIDINIEKIRKELSLFSWDMTFYSLCIFLEDFKNNKIATKAVEFIVNKKQAGPFYGHDEDYISFLKSLKDSNPNKKVPFVGHQVKVSDIKKSYKRLKILFESIIDSLQRKALISDYCLRKNLMINEREKDFYEFCTVDIEKEEHYQRDGIKYQIESDYFHLVVHDANELEVSNAELNADYNLQLQLSIDKAMIWLFDHGMIKSQEKEQLVKVNDIEVPLNIVISFIAVQCIHSKRLYGSVISEIEKKDIIERLLIALIYGMENMDDKGFPFHLRDLEDFKYGFVKAFGNTCNFGMEFRKQSDTVLNQFVFDKDSEGNALFSFDSHTHVKLGNNIFGFRKTLSVSEPSHFAFNILLSDSNNKRYNQDTSITETNLIEGLINNDFTILSAADRKTINDKYKVDFDVLAYKSGVIFSFEVKSTHFRQDLEEINLHTNRELMKAAYQLDKNLDFIDKKPEIIAKALCCSIEEVKSSIKKTYIVSTSMEDDHTYIGGHLKVSYFELMRIISNKTVILPFLSSCQYYPNIYTSKLVNDFANINSESEFYGKLDELFISYNREEVLSASQLIELLDNDTFWNFMKGIKYPIQKVCIIKGKIIVETLKNYSIKPENINALNLIVRHLKRI